MTEMFCQNDVVHFYHENVTEYDVMCCVLVLRHCTILLIIHHDV